MKGSGHPGNKGKNRPRQGPVGEQAAIPSSRPLTHRRTGCLPHSRLPGP